MRQGFLGILICCCASGGISYKVADTANACQEVHIPKWTNPDPNSLGIDTSVCRYSFRSPDSSSLFVGVMCNMKRAQEKYAIDSRLRGGVRRLSESEWDSASPLWPSGSRSDLRPQADGLAFLGHLFPKSGRKWGPGDNASVNQGSTRIVVYSWGGVIDYCTNGPFNCYKWDDHVHGNYWIDLFDVQSATRLIRIQGKFRGREPGDVESPSVWPNSRYFVVPVEPKGMRRLLVCDVDAAAAAHGITTDRGSLPKTSIHPSNMQIQDEPVSARFLGMRDEPVMSPATGQISAVELKVRLDVRVAHRYRLDVELSPGQGKSLGSLGEHVEADLRIGLSEITLTIAVDALRKLGTVGPYKIRFVRVTHPIAEGVALDYNRFEAGQTQSYDLSSADP